MKKYTKLGYAGAMMLAGLAGFTACSSDDDMGDVNPTYNGHSVKTEFAISIPDVYAKGGRMTAEQVQQGGKFLGLEEIYAYAFKVKPAKEQSFTANESGESKIDNQFVMGAVNKAEIHSTTGNSKWNRSVSVATGVNNFLVYGIGDVSADPRTVTQKFNEGATEMVLSTSLTNNVGGVKFTPELISHKNSEGNLSTAVETAFIQYLTAVAKTQDWATSTDPFLQKWYQDFATGVYCGSADNIKYILGNLYTLADHLVNGRKLEELDFSKYLQSDNGAIDAAKVVAAAIKTAITKESDLYLTAVAVSGESSGVYTFTYGGSLANNAKSFPGNYNYPDGAVKLKWSEGIPSFDWELTVGTPSVTADNILAYPAQLLYWANSDIGTSSIPYGASLNPKTDWASFVNQYKGKVVDENTSSIVLKKQLQYGVGSLLTTVSLSQANLQDNKGTEIRDNTYTLTGVVIGNQKEVGWDFSRNTETAGMLSDKDFFVYDKTIPETGTVTVGSSAPAKNYTLVYQTSGVKTPLKDVAAANNEVVNVALEFQNGDTGFYGFAGTWIPAKAKFYMVGQLSLWAQEQAVSNSVNKLSAPPIRHVFEQDYQTTANFMIKSLKSAMLTIPDLRTTNLEFGMSVDLSWKKGVTFDVTIE